MTSIIKNQILKHLSKFAKNLTADKINISTMRGEGEMSNLELNEAVMTDLLELPAWMRITRVWCNRVTVRIHWTKLKSVPIYVSLDEVQVAMETCDELRPMATTQPAYASGGRYGFSDKVIDGMTVTVNSCCVMFKSHAFEASVQVSRIVLESKSPSWQRSDLRMTRLRDPDRGEVLIFKELQWQTVKIEARSTLDQGLSPLRLITNQSHCRIVIKKKINDCSVLGCRLVLILDDLLWVLTDEQMKAALHFLDSLSGLIQKATEHSHQVKAVRKLESLPEYQAQQTQSSRRSQGNTALSKVFAKYDVVETSYHLYSDRIDLHLCDDPGEGRSCAPELEAGGALQVTFKQLELDYYPYHLAYGDRRHWVRYGESIPAQWLDQALQEFRTRLTTLLLNGGPQHTRLARAPPHLNSTPPSGGGTAAAAAAAAGGPPPPSPHRSFVMNQLRKLMSAALVVRINDFIIYRVSTSQRKTVLKEFVMGDKERMNVPGQTSSVHIEMTYFYYPGSVKFPVPPPKAMVHVNPIQVIVDPVTVLWLNAFACNLTRSLSASGGSAPPPYMDLRVEAIMPRLVLETAQDYPLQRDRPSTLHLQTTRLLVCNYRSPDPTSPGSLAGLTNCLERLQAGEMAFGSEFPARDADFQVVPDRLVQHTLGKDHVQPSPADVVASVADFRHGLPDHLLWEEPRDVLFLHMDPFWADFYGTSAVRHRPVPLVDAIPVSLWVYHHRNKVASASEGRVAEQSALLHVPSLVSVQLNHFQYLFLLRQLERLTEMSACLTMDAERLLGAAGAGSVCVSGALPQVDVSLLMPCLLSSKDSSGGDLSVFPDSSSVTSFQEASLMQMRVDSLTEVTAGIVLPADDPPAAAAAAAAANAANATGTSPVGNHVSHNSHNTSNHIAAAGATPPRTRIVPTTLISQASVATGGSPGGQLADLGAGLSQVKKGFNSFLSSIDSALKSPDDQSDTMSVMSDMSSDSDSYVLLNLEMDKACSESIDPLFVVEGALKRVPSVEIASEVTEDTHSEVSLSSAMRKRDVISALTLRLGRLEFVQQGAGNSSSLKVLLRHLSAEQCTAIGWDEFQAKFQLRTKGWQGLDVATEPCNIRMRMDNTFVPVPNQRHHKINVREQVKSDLEVRASDLDLSLLMSTVTNLTDFIEDEILPVPLPMQLHLERLKMRLTEDRPANNITSPGVVPLDVSIPSLRVSRDKDGVFTVHQAADSGNPGRHSAENPASRVDASSSFNNPGGGGGGGGSPAVVSELARLRQRCQLLENQLEQRRGAEERLQYLTVMETRCREAEDEVQGLREEKESLMKTLRYLQEEFLRLDKAQSRRSDAN